MSTVKATNFQNASSATANMVTDASGNVSFGNAVTVAGNTTITGGLVPSSSFLRNRIINGDMRIDQRNAGASVNSPSSAATVYTVDRWEGRGDTEGIFSMQQDSSAPDGFVNSLKITVTTIDSSLGAAQLYSLSQKIEGTNISDLGFGTANATTVTASFWVRSSVTGTFGASVRNSGSTRSYPFTYTISVADTWERKTVTIAGDTSGTWLTTTGIGVVFGFSFGGGTDRSGAAGAWVAANNATATGATNLMATLNATWYVTGVQLEVGTVATPFERQIYSNQLAQCQRYYYRIGPLASTSVFSSAVADSATAGIANGFFPVKMRIAPTALEQSGTASNYSIRTGGTTRTCSAVPIFDSGTTEYLWDIRTTVASGQTAGQGGFLRSSAVTTAYLGWSAEL